MRSAARKQNVEIDITMPADAVKLPSRANKSKIKLVIRQVLRVLRVIFIIAAFNVPLYMMLLFKDWIDK